MRFSAIAFFFAVAGFAAANPLEARQEIVAGLQTSASSSREGKLKEVKRETAV
ncbi:hypothetical protein PM082_018093 [Marasmius tenuissimus]|nr:hypothetical protein PM082_018093 [Marasmius tenuissimus]